MTNRPAILVGGISCVALGAALGIVVASGDDGSAGPTSVSPDAIACQIDDFTESNSAVPVPLVVVEGNQVVDEPPVDFRGSAVSARLNVGNEFESQVFLQLVIVDPDGNRTDSTLYDYELVDQGGPINVLTVDTGDLTLRLQCWIDR